MATSDLTYEEAAELLRYEPDTGNLIWLKYRNSKARAGDIAGSEYRTAPECKIYRYIRVNSSNQRAHRLAWLLMTGSWPVNQIDHRDGNGLNNVWTNLRDVTCWENQKNMKLFKTNKTGYAGVAELPSGRYSARIQANGIHIYGGTFGSIKLAAARRKELEIEHGFHPNHGRR